MAKKLTEEEKQANKDESLIRQAAHTARVRELWKEQEDAEATALASLQYTAMMEANTKRDALHKQRRDAEDAIQLQIDALNKQRMDLSTQYRPEEDRLATLRSQTHNVYFEHKRVLGAEARAKFPDMGNSSYYGCWEPPVGYLEQFKIDNAADIAKRKAKRAADLAKRKAKAGV